MDEAASYNTTDTSHRIAPQLLLHRVEDLRSRPQPQYESAGARASRMIIELSSYQTTPCSSPPNEFCDPVHGPDTKPVVIVGDTVQDTTGEPEQKEYDNYSTEPVRKSNDWGTTPKDIEPCTSLSQQRPIRNNARAKDDSTSESQVRESNSSGNGKIESNRHITALK